MGILVSSYFLSNEQQKLLFFSHDFKTDFNLDFYTEVQDLSHLENALSSASPRFSALNMAICELIEDFSLVGFETLAVEVRYSPFPRPRRSI